MQIKKKSLLFVTANYKEHKNKSNKMYTNRYREIIKALLKSTNES